MSTKRKGDWKCKHCNFNNFASRAKCKNCSKGIRPSQSSQQVAKFKSDWICQLCNFKNFKSRTECKNCSADKSGKNQKHPKQRNNDRDEKTQYEHVKCTEINGDWICKLCGFSNFKSRRECKSCGADKSGKNKYENVKSMASNGDWICKNCEYSNFKSRDICKGCSKDKYFKKWIPPIIPSKVLRLIDKISKNPNEHTQTHPYVLLLNEYIRKYYIQKHEQKRRFSVYEIYCIIFAFYVSPNAITGCWGSSNLATINITKDLKFNLKMKFLVKKAFDQGGERSGFGGLGLPPRISTGYHGPFEFSGNIVIINDKIILLCFDEESVKLLYSMQKTERARKIYTRYSMKKGDNEEPLVVCNLFPTMEEAKERNKRRDVYYQRVKSVYNSGVFSLEYKRQIRENHGKLDWNVIELKYKLHMGKSKQLPDIHEIYTKICKEHGVDSLPPYITRNFLINFEFSNDSGYTEFKTCCSIYHNQQFMHKMVYQ